MIIRVIVFLSVGALLAVRRSVFTGSFLECEFRVCERKLLCEAGRSKTCLPGPRF
jgi:hypothetical protein